MWLTSWGRRTLGSSTRRHRSSRARTNRKQTKQAGTPACSRSRGVYFLPSTTIDSPVPCVSDAGSQHDSRVHKILVTQTMGGRSVALGRIPPALPNVVDRSMKKRASESAGLLLFRRGGGRLEVLLAHPGGPFWAHRDAGA